MTSLSPAVSERPSEQVDWAARVRLVLSYAVLFLLALSFLYPFLLSITTSFKPLPEIAENPVGLIPETWTLEGTSACRA